MSFAAIIGNNRQSLEAGCGGVTPSTQALSRVGMNGEQQGLEIALEGHRVSAVSSWLRRAWAVSRSVPARCSAAAVAFGAGAAVAAAGGKGVTILVHMARTEPMAALVPRPFSFVQGGAHYDGVYFYAIARDPLARGRAHGLIDLAAYRYGHPGYGWLAWVASAGGQPRLVPYALLIISLLGLGVAGFAASGLARDLGLSEWWGLSVAFNPGLLFAVTVDTSEAVEIALALLIVLAWARGRWLWAGVGIAVGSFTKEPLLLFPLAIAVRECLRFAHGRRPSSPRARCSALVIGPILYGVWAIYCRHRLGVFSWTQVSQISWPFSGWVNTFQRAAAQTSTGEYQVGMITTALLVSAAGLLALGLFRAVRRPDPLDAAFIAVAALAFCTNAFVLLYPKDLLRMLALPIALLPFVVARARDSSRAEAAAGKDVLRVRSEL